VLHDSDSIDVAPPSLAEPLRGVSSSESRVNELACTTIYPTSHSAGRNRCTDATPITSQRPVSYPLPPRTSANLARAARRLRQLVRTTRLLAGVHTYTLVCLFMDVRTRNAEKARLSRTAAYTATDHITADVANAQQAAGED